MRLTAAIVVAAGLTSLSGCGSPSPQEAAIDSNAAVLEDQLERAANNLDALADNAADRNAAAALDQAADNLEDFKSNVADSADAAKDNLTR